jgi:hypothetical protein
MPTLTLLLRAVGRFTGRWILAAVVWLPAAPGWADHSVPAAGRTGFGWMSWLLVAGAIAAVSLAAWAFFAPDRPEEHTGRGPREGPASEPPAR